MATANLSKLEAFLQEYPNVKFTPPSSAEYSSARKIFNKSRCDNPLAFVQPGSPSEVAAIVKFANEHGIPFTLRAGGHNLEGRTLVQDAILIDLRALKSVTISADRKSATVQGGIRADEIAKELWAEGLATPTGAIPSVGYAGWAMYGGYGPFSSHWGLGADQIIGATVVNSDGDIINADESILQGIRGAGGLFGVIIDLTIKVYPITSILAGVLLFDSTDLPQVFLDFNSAYHQLLDSEGLPPQLTLQQLIFNVTTGHQFGVSFVWSGDDIVEGQTWSARIANLAPLLANTVAVTTIPDLLAHSGALTPETVYGSAYSLNISKITPSVAEAVGRSIARMPSDPGAMLSIHQLRGPSAAPQGTPSVFVAREPHFMLELCGFSTVKEGADQSEGWARGMLRDLETTERSNILPSLYISVCHSSQAVSSVELLNKVYGPYVEMLKDLKTSFDPKNVFNLTVPSLE